MNIFQCRNLTVAEANDNHIGIVIKTPDHNPDIEKSIVTQFVTRDEAKELFKALKTYFGEES